MILKNQADLSEKNIWKNRGQIRNAEAAYSSAKGMASVWAKDPGPLIAHGEIMLQNGERVGALMAHGEILWRNGERVGTLMAHGESSCGEMGSASAMSGRLPLLGILLAE